MPWDQPLEWMILAFLVLNAGITGWLIWTRPRQSSEVDELTLRNTLDHALSSLRDALTKDSAALRKELSEIGIQQRSELSTRFESLAEVQSKQFDALQKFQAERLDQFSALMSERYDNLAKAQAEFRKTQAEEQTGFKGVMEKQLESLILAQRDLTKSLQEQSDALSKKVDAKQDAIRQQLEEKLKELRQENSQKLEEMRHTVDEKLQSTLEKRLGESFKQVSERLDTVHKGLGEMQTLAGSVGDLKRTLTNVKTRGTWAEVQLENIISDMLTSDQFLKNAQVKQGSQERVEFAIKMPGRDDDGQSILLAVDSKFPNEDYERLQQASETGDVSKVEEASTALERRIIGFAKDISSKYIAPPETTDFAIMYLPTEGLYAEVLRRPGLVQKLQNEHRVTVTGPTTFSAFLTSLQMGFRTLAIEKRSSEVWQVLGGVKTEFGKFGSVIGKVKKKLQEAGNQLDQVDVRTRAMDRKLKSVDALPSEDVVDLLGPVDLTSADEAEEPEH